MFVQQAAVTSLFCVVLTEGTQKETNTEEKQKTVVN